MANPRDLSGTADSLGDDVEQHESMAQSAIRKAEQNPDDPHQYSLLAVPSHLARGLLARYARGDSVTELERDFHERYTPTLLHATQLSKKFFPDHRLCLHVEQPASWMLLFALVCFDKDGSALARLYDWFTPDVRPLLFDMVVKAFVPTHAYAEHYNGKTTAIPHERQVDTALLAPQATWSAAFATYMQQWPHLMKAHGYREHVEEGKHHFGHFPLHLGLAVCAFDIDDTAFHHLPFYPHELVGYYREHIRHTRDARRTSVYEPGSDLPDSARPRPEKFYVLSKDEAYQRWVVLVCGDDARLITRARKALGRRKSMPALDRAMQALATAGLGIRADLKDDDTVAGQLHTLCQSWNIAVPTMPVRPTQGLSRATAILSVLDAELATHGLSLVLLDDDSDAWNAILCRSSDEALFAELCEQLDVGILAKADWQS